jgi:hypothetical protein
MATYHELVAQKAALDAQIEEGAQDGSVGGCR